MYVYVHDLQRRDTEGTTGYPAPGVTDSCKLSRFPALGLQTHASMSSTDFGDPHSVYAVNPLLTEPFL